jgi:hypothetical protein
MLDLAVYIGALLFDGWEAHLLKKLAWGIARTRKSLLSRQSLRFWELVDRLDVRWAPILKVTWALLSGDWKARGSWGSWCMGYGCWSSCGQDVGVREGAQVVVCVVVMWSRYGRS